MKRMKLNWFLFKLLPLIFLLISLSFRFFLILNFIWKDLLSTFNTVWSTIIFCCMIIALNFLETFVDVGISIFMCSFWIFTISHNTPFFLLFKWDIWILPFLSFLLFDTNLQWLIIICRTLYITIWFIETPTQFSVIWSSFFMRWWTLCNNEKV